MKLKTTHFGIIDVNEEELIDFPEGLPGFENVKKYALIGHDAGGSPFFWLQSADNPELCFVVTDPFLVYDNYGVDVSDDDVKFLQITDANKVITLAITVIPEDVKKTRVNLKAPILINTGKKLGKQVIQKDDTLPIRYFLFQNY